MQRLAFAAQRASKGREGASLHGNLPAVGRRRRCSELLEPLRAAARAALPHLYERGSFEQLRNEEGSAGALQRRAAVTSLFFILGFSVGLHRAWRHRHRLRPGVPAIASDPHADCRRAHHRHGLHFLGVYRIGLLDRQLRHNGPGVASGPLGGFLLGLAFAIGWTRLHWRCLLRSCRSRPAARRPGKARRCSRSIRWAGCPVLPRGHCHRPVPDFLQQVQAPFAPRSSGLWGGCSCSPACSF